MNTTNETIITSYLPSLPHYFWHWEDDHDVATWRNGTTIVFREELVTILERLAPSGLPPMGGVLLALSACREDWGRGTAEVGILKGVADFAVAPAATLMTDSPERMLSHIDRLMNRALNGLELIGTLPPPYRTGPTAKAHLLELLFERLPGKLAPGLSKQVVEALRQGDWTELKLPTSVNGMLIYESMEEDLRAIQVATAELDAATLLNRLLTGLDAPPAPAPVQELEEPEASLLARLAADPETAGLARIAHHLQAVLHIPRHATGSGDLPLGGFSDIANRGRLDRLLLTELAQDDLTLAVRVANGEALFLRREEPPAPPLEDRVILLDNGIRLWGLPRVYALAVAVAFQEHETNGIATVLSHQGERFSLVDLQSMAGIKEQLQVLEPGAHPGQALRRYMAMSPAAHAGVEHILITHESVLADRQFQRLWSALEITPAYIAAVDREGNLRFMACTHSGRQVLAKVTLDLEDLVGKVEAETLQPGARGPLPMIFGLPRFPLLLPATLHKLNRGMSTDVDSGVVAVTSDRRLMHWTERKAGRQLTDRVPVGTAFLTAVNELNEVVLLVGIAGKNYVLIQAHLHDAMPDYEPIPLDLRAKVAIEHLVLSTDWLMVFIKTHVLVFDPHDGTLLWEESYPEEARYFADNRVTKGEEICTVSYNGRKLVYQQWDTMMTDPMEMESFDFEVDLHRVHRQFCQNFIGGQSLMRRFRKIGVTDSDDLALIGENGRVWQLEVRGDYLYLTDNRNTYVNGQLYQGERLRHEISFSERTERDGYSIKEAGWECGASAWLDMRGLLHLRSQDAGMPEITLVLVNQKAMAAWLSDGHQTGPHKYLDPEMGAPITAQNVLLLTRSLLQLLS